MLAQHQELLAFMITGLAAGFLLFKVFQPQKKNNSGSACGSCACQGSLKKSKT